MSTETQDLIAEQLAEIHAIIVEREGEDVQDQFEIEGYLICINVDGSAYEDPIDENHGLLTLIQIEKGPLGMEELIACAMVQYPLEQEDEGEHFIITGENEKISETLDVVREKVYRHWHWLDLPSSLAGDEEDDEFVDEDDFDFK